MVPWASQRAPVILPASRSNTSMKVLPMILRFSSGSHCTSELAKELSLGVHREQIDRQVIAGTERQLYLMTLVLAQQPVVDKHTVQLIADRTGQQRRNSRWSQRPLTARERPDRNRPLRVSGE